MPLTLVTLMTLVHRKFIHPTVSGTVLTPSTCVLHGDEDTVCDCKLLLSRGKMGRERRDKGKYTDPEKRHTLASHPVAASLPHP